MHCVKYLNKVEYQREYEQTKDKNFKAEKEVQDVLNNFGVKHLYAQNETIAAVAERAIKTIKTKINRYLTQQSYRYTDKLQTFVKSYNNTYHRTIGMAPESVNKRNETAVWWRMYWPKYQNIVKKTKTVIKPFRFKIGDKSDSHMLEIHFPVNMMKYGGMKY